jgi:formylglycine-generating enzyme required for sulfatase activity
MTIESSANNPLEQLIAILSSKDFDLTGREIADILWLNLQRQQIEQQQNNVTPSPTPPTPPTPTTPSTPSTPPTPSKAEIYPQPQSTDSPTPYKTKALPLRVPDAPSLREPLSLAQALKPLMRRVESGKKTVLDEITTSERTAAEGICIPVLKSEPEPWLDLALVIDESKSMLLWRHTIGELKRLLEHYGAFRDVRTWGLILVSEQKGQQSIRIRPGIGETANEQRFGSPSELIDPSGRRLVLVVSDCVAAMWRDGTVTPALKIWAKSQPLAIVQMLPDWLWLRTGLGAGASVRLGSLSPGVANQHLLIKELLLWKDFNLETGIKIPVLTLEPEVALIWSQMVAGKSQAIPSGFVFPSQLESQLKADTKLSTTSKSSISQLKAEDRVYRFRMTASPMARKLAGLLAAAPVINLPVVRLIQETMLPKSRQVHVAEVFLGGLLKPLTEIKTDTNSDAVQYDFMDEEIRNILLDSAPVSDSAEVINAVSLYIADQLGKSLQEFVALLQAPGQAEDSQVKPFAQVTTKLLKKLGGDYAYFAKEIEENQVVNFAASLRDDGFDVVGIVRQIIANFTDFTPSHLTKYIKNALINQTIHEQFIEKFGGGQGNRFSTRNLRLNGEANQIFLSKGKQIPATLEINHDCPECGTAINQIIVGIGGEEHAQACVWIGGSSSQDWQTVSFSLNIPDIPGVYYIRTRYAQAYNREDALGWWKVDRPDGPTEAANIGAVVVGVNLVWELFPGEYQCFMRWGGEIGVLYEDIEPRQLFISREGEVRLVSYSNSVVIQNWELTGNTLSWTFKHNQTAAALTFKFNSENQDLWETKQTGKLFEGWLQYPGQDRIDFWGKFISSELSQTSQSSFPGLQIFEFDVVTVNARGEEIKREKNTARYFAQNLGKNITLEMVAIPGGKFMMGSPSNETERYDDESPQHEVTVPPFFMGKYPVTQAQWRAVATLPQVNRELNPDPSRFKGDNLPVERISWYEAVEFCDRLSKYTGQHYRLPSEAEWEYACRAGTTTPFHFGETITSDLANYNAEYSYGDAPKGQYRQKTTPVGSFEVANAFGLYNMHGNVWEWCADHWHNNYKGAQAAPADGSAWLDSISNENDNHRYLLRGGSWNDSPRGCRSACRLYHEPDYRDDNRGFRVVVSAART